MNFVSSCLAEGVLLSRVPTLFSSECLDSQLLLLGQLGAADLEPPFILFRFGIRVILF
jgi:hypothetical protein